MPRGDGLDALRGGHRVHAPQPRAQDDLSEQVDCALAHALHEQVQMDCSSPLPFERYEPFDRRPETP